MQLLWCADRDKVPEQELDELITKLEYNSLIICGYKDKERARMAKKKGWLASDWSKCLGYNLCNKQHCCKLHITEFLVPLCLCSPCQNHLFLQPPKTLQITALCIFIAPLDNNPNCCCLWFGNQIRTWFVYIQKHNYLFQVLLHARESKLHKEKTHFVNTVTFWSHMTVCCCLLQGRKIIFPPSSECYLIKEKLY